MKTNLLYILIIASLAISCSRSPKYIEEEQLRDIITQAIITDAMLLQNGTMASVDTLDYYSTILNRAGYTLEDLEYTIEQMAARKSNPLNNLFDDINNRITETANKANYRYRLMERLDTLAMNHATDTLLKSDTIINGALKKFTFKVPAKRIGTYTIIFDYQSHNSYDIPSRQVISQFTNDTCKLPLDIHKRLMWVNRSFQERQFKQSVEQKEPLYDVLEFQFAEQKTEKRLTFKDTSYIKQVRIYYQPSKEDARALYLRDKTGLGRDLNFEINYDKEFIKPTQDSLTASPFTRW